MVLAAGLLLALLVAVGMVTAVAVGVKRSRRRANEVVPGVTSPAPVAWAGAHSPEARLHRRLRDAVRAMRAQPAVAGPAEDLRGDLERAALALDEHLVAVAALPPATRSAPLARVDEAVAGLEEAAAMWGARAVGGVDDGSTLVDGVRLRLRLLDQARAELDRAVPGGRRTAVGGAGSADRGLPGDQPPDDGDQRPAPPRDAVSDG